MSHDEDRPELLGNYRPGEIVGVNDRGDAVGQWHPRARLTDEEIDLMRELHEGGMGVSEIARKFGVSRGTAHDIVTFRRRASSPVGWRKVRATAGAAAILAKHIKEVKS